MQCEFCRYEFSLREVQDGAACPRCEGRRKAEQQRKEADAVVAPHVRKLLDEHRGAQPVVILDVHMSFNSMVWFMVKWAIASIPAIIILFFIGFMALAVFGGLVGGLTR